MNKVAVRDIFLVSGLGTIICLIEAIIYPSVITVMVMISLILFTFPFILGSFSPPKYFGQKSTPKI